MNEVNGNVVRPEDEYAEHVAQSNPEELEKARQRVKQVLEDKCLKLVGADVLENQIFPMVNEMSIEDCENLALTLEKQGIFGLMRMGRKHQKKK